MIYANQWNSGTNGINVEGLLCERKGGHKGRRSVIENEVMVCRNLYPVGMFYHRDLRGFNTTIRISEYLKNQELIIIMRPEVLSPGRILSAALASDSSQ